MMPSDPSPHDTQPISPVSLRRLDTVQVALALVILVTSLSLLLTLAWVLWPSAPVLPMPAQLTVTLHVDGESRPVTSSAATVDALLAEQAVALYPEDALSPAADTALVDGMTITVERARDVQVVVNGQPQTVRTHSDSPLEVLEGLGLVPGPSDQVWVDGTLAQPAMLALWPLPPERIELQSAATVTISDAGQTIEQVTTAATVGDALFEAGVTVYLADRVLPDVAEPVSDGLTITIERAVQVIIQADGATVETRTQNGTVADALAAAGVTLVGMDYTSPPEDTPVVPGMTIDVVRVTEDIVAAEETVPYETTYEADASMNLDVRAVRQPGQNGLIEARTRVRYENGVEVSRELVESVVTRAPVNEVVAYGTNIVLQTIDTPEGPRQYWRKLRVYATSYHPAALGGDNVTSIGETLQKGIIGADPRLIPYRTQMFVPGYGVGMMADTGGPRSSRFWIDLGYSDEDFQPWHRYVDLYLLTPVPENLNYLLPDFTPLRGTTGY